MAQTQTAQEIVQRYARASAANDLDELARLRHPDWTVDWPQSGERVHGNESFAEIVRNYPGGRPTTELSRIVGSEDRWVLTPATRSSRWSAAATSGGASGG